MASALRGRRVVEEMMRGYDCVVVAFCSCLWYGVLLSVICGFVVFFYVFVGGLLCCFLDCVLGIVFLLLYGWLLEWVLVCYGCCGLCVLGSFLFSVVVFVGVGWWGVWGLKVWWFWVGWLGGVVFWVFDGRFGCL